MSILFDVTVLIWLDDVFDFATITNHLLLDLA